MVSVREQVSIDAPLSEVFAYMDRPANQPEITPSLSRSETIKERPDGSKVVAYTYKMAGVSLDGRITAVEYVPERRIQWEMTGDLSGEITWEFERADDGTVVTYAANYDVPIPVLDAVVEPLVARYNRREVRTTLENLRTRLEHGHPS